MVTQPTSAQRAQLAHEVRKRFVAEAGQSMVELGAAVQERLTALTHEAAPSREMQVRRDVWTAYQRMRAEWLAQTVQGWQLALKPAAVAPSKAIPEGGLALVGTDVMDNKIMASRLVLGVNEKVSAELKDLRLRLKAVEGVPEGDAQDVLRPEVLVLVILEQWAKLGMPPESWLMVNDAVQALLTERLQKAYANCNAFLIKQGVLPTIELKDHFTRIPSAPPRAGSAGAPASGPSASERPSGGGKDPVSASPAGSGTASGSAAMTGGGRDAGAAGHPPVERQHPGYGGAAEETRMMTATTPLARARSRAQGVLGQLKRLLVGSVGGHFDATEYQPPSPALAAAIAVHPAPKGAQAVQATVMDDDSSAGVVRVAGALRQKTEELKSKAETKSEKATIEIVALMFQSILQEDRIPPSIRVWFARLQMPVLREALAEPDFFGTLTHPARQLIDRMGSCVMGFNASGIKGSALEQEIKRVVQVIEQYPETGKRVYQLVYEEFQKFLAQYLTESASTQKVVNVAQQVEEKETLTIQYTIEMRNMLRDMPVRDEIRDFLFKVWADVLAMVAVSQGPQHAQTLEFKKTASDLVWAASAKPNRTDRARVIQNLPQLVRQLRAGMTLINVPAEAQEIHIKTVSDTLADAFLSKTQAIPAEQIQAMTERLANLEDFVSDDGTEDLPLDGESIELMLGVDASTIDVVANGGSKPTAAMLAWAQELQLGAWFSLDHNSRVTQVQFVWRSERKQLNLFASIDGHSYLIQAGRLAAYLQAGLLLPQEEEALTVRATRDALVKLEANPERLFR